MRLTYRLAAVLLAFSLLVFAVQAWTRLDHDLSLFEEDMRQDHRAMARALGNAIVDVWAREGERRALELVQRTNEREADILIEWQWADALASAEERFPAGGEAARALALRTPYFHADRRGDPKLHTYFPVSVASDRIGALHLSESLAAEAGHVRQTVLRTVMVTLLLALGAGLTAAVVGAHFVGRPIQALVAKARRTGAGDLGGPIVLRRRDELGVLADEMNAMCDRLAEIQRRLAEEIQTRMEAMEQLRHAERLMTVGRLSAAIAHELGTPLNVVAVRARMIADAEVTGPAVAVSAQKIAEHAEHMATIIHQLLSYARPRPAERLATDLRVIVRQTLALLEPMAVAQRAQLLLETADEPVLAEVDASQIQQVLTNLIVNGLQSMSRPGAVRLRLGVERRPPPGRPGEGPRPFACLAVTDEGAGIKRADLPQVFDPFFSTKPSGMGLGLSVTQSIVQEHGGFIEVASMSGLGCMFTVFLPQTAPEKGAQTDAG